MRKWKSKETAWWIKLLDISDILDKQSIMMYSRFKHEHQIKVDSHQVYVKQTKNKRNRNWERAHLFSANKNMNILWLKFWGAQQERESIMNVIIRREIYCTKMKVIIKMQRDLDDEFSLNRFLGFTTFWFSFSLKTENNFWTLFNFSPII